MGNKWRIELIMQSSIKKSHGLINLNRVYFVNGVRSSQRTNAQLSQNVKDIRAIQEITF